ncbi:MAG TPA: hydroxymethylbilane synthase, partial [Methylomirabilota bacterium]|nr:hydroxymethylbilane synthase [Methylomirabilota bacterium]
DTRLRKLHETPYDAVVLAAAGLRRLGMWPPQAVVLEPHEMLPAVGQGTLAVQVRTGDVATRQRVDALDDAGVRATALAERAFLAAMGGSCAMPLAAYARWESGALRLDAFVATPDGDRMLRDGVIGQPSDPEALGRGLAGRMLAAGADRIVKASLGV